MRILFTTPIMEYPASGGPQLRIANSIKALSKVCELDIIHRTSEPVDMVERTREHFQDYAVEYHVLDRKSPIGTWSRGLSLVERILNRFIDIRSAKQAEYILNHIGRRKIDVLWFGYGNLSFPLIKHIKAQCPSLKIVCDTDSVWSRFVMRELPFISGVRKLRVWVEGHKKSAEERAWVNICDVTTAVSEVDAEYYRGISDDKARIHRFSNVIDVESYNHPPPPLGDSKRPSIYLAGSFGHYYSPMDSAARWVLSDILPRIRKVFPNVHFYIIGRNSDVGFGDINDPHVTVTGKVDSVLPYLCHTDVALVPLKFESGTRFKILEAGTCKVPLVSTTLGAEGIPVIDEEHILIADEPDDFSNAVIRLLEDKVLANRLAINCHDLVNKGFSVESLAEEAKSILDYLNND